MAASFREAAAARLYDAFVRDVLLRDERDDDLPFLRDLYAASRADELAQVDWPDDQKRAFLDHQFELQREQYRQHYVGAEWLLIERDGAPIGRLYLKRSDSGVRLMDIALMTPSRGAGLGTRITQALLDWADEQDLPVTLHVEPFNPAYRLYRRFGFAYVRSTGVYHFLERPLRAPLQSAGLSAYPRAQ
jgi:RimJ/RimL family protein N-acetyltransferase